MVSTQHTSVDSRDGFAELVRDHADLVYSVARRQLGNAAMAEDVVQAVFILLWRKAGSIKGSVAGWLVRATYLACLDARKLAMRREYHERAAAMMKAEQSNVGTEGEWENYATVLDEAMVRLRVKDRDAVALRYLRGLSFKQVGEALGTGEDAAKKRVGRAIERLRETMSKKAAMPAAAVLSTQLEARGIEAAPQSLVTIVTASAGSGMKGTFAGEIARKAVMREAGFGAKIGAALLIVVVTGGLLAYFALQSGGPDAATAPMSANQPADDRPIVLKINAIIDGSDVLNITPAGVTWRHGAYKRPLGVMINGAVFDTRAVSTLAKIGLGEADLSSAEVIRRSGRGTVAMEKTGDGIAIHFADPQPGAAPYEISVGFTPKSNALVAMPVAQPTTLPSADSIFLDVKASIAGSDVLTITAQGEKWQHVATLWPTDVMINDQPWDIRMRPSLDDAGLAKADLTSAEVVERSGRETAVMEKTGDGVTVYFGDAVGDAGQYEIKIRFSRKQ